MPNQYSDYLTMPDLLNDATPNTPYDKVSQLNPALAGLAKELALRAGQAVDALVNMPTGYKMIPPPTIKEGADSMWEANLKALEKECELADAELRDNRFALRAEFLAKKQSYIKSKIEMEQKASQPKILPKSSSYINKSLVETLKKQTLLGSVSSTTSVPKSTSKSPFEEAKSALAKKPVEIIDVPVKPAVDEQKFIMRIGMMSDCNVSIQDKSTWQGKKYRLLCDRCGHGQEIPAAVYNGRLYNDSAIVSFCTEHRHEVVVPVVFTVSEGRKFRDED